MAYISEVHHLSPATQKGQLMGFWNLSHDLPKSHALTLFILMNFPIHSDKICLGLPIVYLKRSQVEFSILSGISVLKGCFSFGKQCRL